MADKETKKKKGGMPTQMGLYFRVAAGVYLLYLAYSIYTGAGEMEGVELIAFAASIIIFAVVGAVVIFSSLKSLQKGEYEGGAGDPKAGDGGEDAEAEKESVKASGTDRIRFGEEDTLPEKKEEERQV